MGQNVRVGALLGLFAMLASLIAGGVAPLAAAQPPLIPVGSASGEYRRFPGGSLAHAGAGSAAQASSARAPLAEGWQTILSEDFEGSFPGAGWNIYDAGGDGYERSWDDVRGGRAYSGESAAWPADSGADRLDAPPYAANMDAWMVYGPFDLSDAADAQVSFALWRAIEPRFDSLYVGVSSNGADFYGQSWDGIADWERITVALDPYLGDSSVWVSWAFRSDVSLSYEGPYVDDLLIEKLVQFCGPYPAASGGQASQLAHDLPADQAPRTTGGAAGLPLRIQLAAALPGAAPAPASAALPGSWQTIVEEDFEGLFPGVGWQLADYSPNGCEQLWNDSAAESYSGGRAAWPAAGGRNALNPASSGYPPNMDSWMIYGPFSMADAAAAEASFALRHTSDPLGGSLAFGVSGDGKSFSALSWAGTSEWEQLTVDLASVPGIIGDPSVWVAWSFRSDAAGGGAGPWVDDIRLRKLIAAPAQPNITVSPPAIALSLRPGQRATRELMLVNSGDGALRYDLSISEQPAAAPQLRFPRAKLDPRLSQPVLQAADGVGALVYLAEQADLSRAYTISDWQARGAYVYRTLYRHAERSQAGLRARLAAELQAGAISAYQPLYIVNAVLVRGQPAALSRLAARQEVAYIEATQLYSLPDPGPSAAPAQALPAVAWGIATIRADRVWAEYANQGAGVVVASIDSGVLASHPALIDSYRGTASGGHDYNWYDPTATYPSAPGDNNGHGTHIMGTLVGSSAANQVGVAPAAQWIAAKGCEDRACRGEALLAAAQWVLAPFPIGGGPAQADPSRRPHVVNNSWGSRSGDLWYQAVVNAWRAADIFPAFSAGNSGPDAGSLSSPGDYAESFSSGATDSADQIAVSSSRGPSALTSETKPNLSAPGINIYSTMNDGGYALMSGTSMASPHTAGCVALIRAARLGLSIDDIEDLLTSTAIDRGPPGPDPAYGAGRLDCYAAVRAASAGRTWLTAAPMAGLVPPLSSQIITLSIDSAGLATGVYSAEIQISSNDPDQPTLRVPVQLSIQAGGQLSLPAEVLGYPGGLVEVPVALASNGLAIGAAAFSIDYDQRCLSFDPSDSNGDGKADAISSALPTSFALTSAFDAADSAGEIDITIADLAAPIAALADGPLLRISYSVRPECQPAAGETLSATLRFASEPRASLGGTAGESIGALTMHGAVSILSGRLGDCNGDRLVGAADISAVLLEIFDGDGADPKQAAGGSFSGDAAGCDANRSGAIEAADSSAIVLLAEEQLNARPASLEGSAVGIDALALPGLEIARVRAQAGDRVVVPISFTSHGGQVAALAFSINYDERLLGFEPTDANNDGLPDALVLNLPRGMLARARVDSDDRDGEIDLLIYPALAMPPLLALSDGLLAELIFTVAEDSGTALVSIAARSFGGANGYRLVGTTDAGAVIIGEPPRTERWLYLPLLRR